MRSISSGSLKHWIPAILAALASGILLILFPGNAGVFGSTVLSHAKEMAMVLPAVLVLMGLMTVAVSNRFIERHLGRSAGFRGLILAFLIGTLPTGPLYVAFPFASTLRRKGAGTANIVIFLTAWASMKAPQELMELKFLGAGFMMARLGLTLVSTALMAFVLSRVADIPVEKNTEKE